MKTVKLEEGDSEAYNCELIKTLLNSIEDIQSWFKKRDEMSRNRVEKNYRYHNVSLLMIYF